MTDIHVDLPSAARGLRAMSSRREIFRRWSIRLVAGKPRFWLHLWTPTWHEGRGPYLTCGIGRIALLRGY